MAVRITLKRSSIYNKRPSAEILDPGELALNTNALTPGLFFEADNNKVVKVGPTAVSITPPVVSPSLGETWYNDVTGELNVGVLQTISTDDLQQAWGRVSSPYLGGTNGHVVFVAPEFPNSTDSIYNNGQANPFRTLNRAVIEVAKQSIVQQNESDRVQNNRFTIVVAPGFTPIYNGPGFPIPSSQLSDDVPVFNVDFESDNPTKPNVLALEEFNSETGGLLLPRGTSIVGMDLRKTYLLPTYVPTYKNPTTGEGQNQPHSAILKWTGNSHINDLTFSDKRETVSITDIRTGQAGEALFVSGRPHCFGRNDLVYFSFTPGAVQTPVGVNTAPITSGFYYVFPIECNTFYLSYSSLNLEPNFIERAQAPKAPQGGIPIADCIWNIYSHNRLRALYCATKEELDEFYVKVQLAFPKTFHGKTNQAEVVNPGETEIVAPVPEALSESLLSNSTANASAYASNVSVRSSYGMCGIEHDGALVTGFKSFLAASFTCVSLQKDPAAYEIFTSIQDPVSQEAQTNWYTLQYATWASIPSGLRPESPRLVTKAQQLALLNTTNLVNIRWFYDTRKSDDGKSLGIPDFYKDFRHFATRVLTGAFGQCSNCWSVGTAVGFWAYSGGYQTLQSCSSNFGSMAIRTEGFAGIGSAGNESQSFPPGTGFTFAGIRMPTRLTASDTQASRQLYLGPNVLSVVTSTSNVTLISLGEGFQPINILPFSLSAGTGIYALWGSVEYRAFLVDDGAPPVVFNGDGSVVLRVRSQDCSFPLGTIISNPPMKEWSSPFIKRWQDPRNNAEANYALILANTNPDQQSPQPGSVLRLNQTTSAAAKLLRPGVQFDPGSSGGWGRVFQIASSQSSASGNSPQFNETLLNRSASTEHYVGLSLCDYGVPWLDTQDHAHGEYTTFSNRNWYASCNDFWNGIYYSVEGVVPTGLKLSPLEFNSPWATTYCTEKLELVKNTFQGSYAKDPEINEYLDDSSYFRGAEPASVNYDLEFAYNGDNGSPYFGLITYNLPSNDVTYLAQSLEPGATILYVDDVKDIIPNPYKEFVVVSLGIPLGGRVEYCQVIQANEEKNTLTVIRGIYNSGQTEAWNSGTIVTVQLPGSLVEPSKYDVNWAPSKMAMIRFLSIMGYSKEGISKLLTPQFPSSRNIRTSSISLPLKDGYAVTTGAWPIELVQSSRIDASNHSFFSAGTISYSRGLPIYQQSEIPTKQYYDFLFSRVWGGTGTISSLDETGSLPTGGSFTQVETGRPYGSRTSLISDVSVGESNQGAGGGGDGVTSIFTGPGILGGPIFSTGTLSLSPPLNGNIGGVKAGSAIVISEDGTISSGPSGSPDVPGAVMAGTAIAITSDGTISAVPSGNPQVPGAVKQGTGLTIATDGTISLANPPIQILDSLSPLFNGVITTFDLTINSKPVYPAAAQFVLVVVGGVVQTPFQAYTITGNKITFTSPPPTNSTFYGLFFG